CNHDDYFHTNPKAGSYLATHWNIANNQFLMKEKGGDGTDPNPNPSPSPSPTKQPTGGPAVTVSQVQADSAMASWPKVDGAAWYQVLLNGKHLTWVQSTALRIYNLQPGSQYKVTVSVRNSSGRDTGPGKTTTFRTTSKGSGTTTPNTRYLLGNGSTGMNAELYGGYAADGTVLVGGRANGYTQQQWYFDDAGSGFVRLRSAVSGKCLQIGGAPTGGVWVAQQPCGDSIPQKWKLSSSGGGVIIADTSGHYALTVSKRPYYGNWLIDLQKADGRPAQVWTVQKAS
ncbi:RICIN domain-containing protein, partial [Streptomyces sp. NPDC127051]|uniref:RICIN domain-containing protein n=1 Tax=Streptomyces sp. NPDC127051 TaxID=3347119 RepID=UPI0036669006